MARVLVRLVLLVSMTLSLLSFIGCSGPFDDPYGQANDSVKKANEAIDEHNRLFEEARSTYAETKDAIEAGGDPSEEAERLTRTREAMEEAQANLLKAQESLAGVQDLNVDPKIIEYEGLLSDALGDQSAAESQEAEYYRILEGDPNLEEDRQKALDALDEAKDGYQKAKDAYGRARQLADANPDLIKKG